MPLASALSTSSSFAALTTIRDFVTQNYGQIKRLNPQLPFFVRPGTQIEKPKLVVRYGMMFSFLELTHSDYGREATRTLEDFSPQQVKLALKELVEIGEFAPKANLYHWQDSYPQEDDCIDYNRVDPNVHHV